MMRLRQWPSSFESYGSGLLFIFSILTYLQGLVLGAPAYPNSSSSCEILLLAAAGKHYQEPALSAFSCV